MHEICPAALEGTASQDSPLEMRGRITSKPLPSVADESVRLAYRFALAAGYLLVGSEDAFAVLLDGLDSRKWVAVFGDMRVAHDICFEHQAAQDALEMAQALRAVFRVVDGTVRCEVDGLESMGESYVDAAMRAVVLHQSVHGARQHRGVSGQDF